MKKKIRDLERILEVYAIAEHREQEAHDFYINAAAKVSLEAEKKILLELAKFELKHLTMMKERYESTLKQLQALQSNQENR